MKPTSIEDVVHNLAVELDEPHVAQEIVPMTTRPLMSADYAFVYGTWMQGHYEKSNFAKGIEWQLYKNFHHALIEKALAGGGIVACAPEYQDQIYGYVVFAGPVLHYIYTKNPLRRFGVANHLMEQAGFRKGAPLTFTQLNNQDLIHLLRKKWPLARFNPYVLER